MRVASEFYIDSIPSKESYPWLLKKHYARRIPSISYAFGLYNKFDLLVGICTYGRPIAHSLIKNAFGGDYQEEFLELNRLVVNDGLPKNTLSYFVSQSLKILPKPKVIVSYADSSQNHHGYIYQATNWVYTGLSAEFKDYMIKGYEHLHSASIMDKVGRSDSNGHLNKVELLKKKYGEENIYMVDRPRKHRYFFFIGDKKEKKDMLNKLKYKICPYPKGNNKKYDASYRPNTQVKLF